MITEADIQTSTYYGTKRRVKAHTWNDGARGVNYSVEGVRSMFPMYCSKASFVLMANDKPIDAGADLRARMAAARNK